MQIRIDCRVTLPTNLATELAGEFGLKVENGKIAIESKDYQAIEKVLTEYIVNKRVDLAVKQQEVILETRMNSYLSMIQRFLPSICGDGLGTTMAIGVQSTAMGAGAAKPSQLSHLASSQNDEQNNLDEKAQMRVTGFTESKAEDSVKVSTAKGKLKKLKIC